MVERSSRVTELAIVQEQLSRLERPSVFAQELRQYPFYPLQDMLYGEYETFLLSEELTPTYFFAADQRRAVALKLQKKLGKAQAFYEPSAGAVVMFETGRQIADSHVYWHEQWHALGRSMQVRSEGRLAFQKVGYQTSLTTVSPAVERGSFLEEAVVDWLAAKSNVRFWSERGVELTERQSVEEAGGEIFLFTRDVFRSIILHGGPDIEKLLVQTRFYPELQSRLLLQLNRKFGKGTAKDAYRASFNTDEMLTLIKTHIQPTR